MQTEAAANPQRASEPDPTADAIFALSLQPSSAEEDQDGGAENTMQAAFGVLSAKVRELEQDVQAVAADRDALQRTVLGERFASAVGDSPGDDTPGVKLDEADDFDNILLVEEECVR